LVALSKERHDFLDVLQRQLRAERAISVRIAASVYISVVAELAIQICVTRGAPDAPAGGCWIGPSSEVTMTYDGDLAQIFIAAITSGHL